MNINNKRGKYLDDNFRKIFNFSANETVFYASLIGIFLGQELDVYEQNALGNFLMLIGQELETMSAQNSEISNASKPKDNSN